MAAIEPGEDLERLAGHQHVAGADDGAARLIDYLGRDRILVVLIAVQFLGHRRVDADLHGTVGPIGTSFSRTTRVVGNCGYTRRGPGAGCPNREVRIPFVIGGKPPVARP